MRNVSRDASRLRVKTACSRAPSAAEAVREVAERLEQPDPSLTVLFISPKYDVEELAGEIRAGFREPVIGCTTAGEISPKGYERGSITGFSLAGREIETHSYLIESLRDLDSVKVERVVDDVREKLKQTFDRSPEARSFGLLFIDGLSFMEEHVIALLGNALEDVPIVGGSSGDDMRFEQTWIYHDGRFVSNAALFTLFITTLPFRLIKTQHFVATDTRLVISKATPECRLVHEINGRAAAEEYARIIGRRVEELSPTLFSEHPLMLRLGGQYYVRSIQKPNDDGSLTFFCAIDEGLVLRLATGEQLVENLKDAFEGVRDEIPDIKLTIGCDCVLRRLEVQEKQLETAVNEILIRNHVIGFNTYGEQFLSVHINQTFTGIALGK